MLKGRDGEHIERIVQDFVRKGSSTLICRRLLPHMTDSELLSFATCLVPRQHAKQAVQHLTAQQPMHTQPHHSSDSKVLAPAGPGAAASAKHLAPSQQTSQAVNAVLFGLVRWKELPDLLLHN